MYVESHMEKSQNLKEKMENNLNLNQLCGVCRHQMFYI